MHNFSIKWKLTVSFVLLGITLVGLYVTMATETFESDKISYIFDSEQAQLENMAKQIDQRIDRVIFDSRSVMAGFDFTSKKLNSIGQKLFNDQQDVLAIEILDVTHAETLLKLTKNNVKVPQELHSEKLASNNLNNNPKEAGVLPVGGDEFIISSTEKNSDGDALSIRIFVQFKDIIPQNVKSQLVLSQGEKILNESNNKNLNAMVTEIISEFSRDRSAKTMLKNFKNEKFLISSTPLRYANLRMTSIVDEKIALGALKVLFQRSVVFMLFSVFATVIISLLLSSGLTKSLQRLTAVAEKISHGDFSSHIQANSNDEVGVLSGAFSKMSEEIQRLLVETKDKARMESELKTAKLVQESLFPKVPYYVSGNIELNGLFVTSTECGGDWWYYFEKGDQLYIIIADATGHGTPAALITCAARALFSQFERSNVTLEEMAYSWDLCVAECSNQKMMMTGLLVELNKVTGHGKFINASHELPLLVSKDLDDKDSKFKCEPILIPVGARLGEKKQVAWVAQEFKLNPQDKLIIYTDGLLGVINPQGKEFGERKMGRAIEKMSEDSVGALDFTNKLYSVFEKHRDNTPLPDDVTLVVLEWKNKAHLNQKGQLVA